MKLIISISKVIAALGIISTVVWGAFRMYDNIIHNQEETQDMVEYINTEQSWMAEDITKISDSLDIIKDHQEKQDGYMQDMENAAKFYIHNQKAMTEEAMEEALEILLKKSEPIVYVPSGSTR